MKEDKNKLEQTTKNTKLKCSKCGKENHRYNAIYCTRCGKKLER